MVVIRRPAITYDTTKSCYKDGLHLLIPGIQIPRNAKHYLIKKIIDNEILESVFSDVDAVDMLNGTAYSRSMFLDKASAYVNVALFGCASKMGRKPYKLEIVFEVNVTQNARILPSAISNTKLLDPADAKINLCHELSLNYESSNPIIKKSHYDLYEHFAAETVYLDLVKRSEAAEKQLRMNPAPSGEMDFRTKEISDILDLLKQERAEDYTMWRGVLCALASESANYKPLAEKFSRRSDKFDEKGFEEAWSGALVGSTSSRKITGRSLHYWAKEDNPEGYKAINRNTVFNSIKNKIYGAYNEGLLQHADIARVLYNLMSDKYASDKSGNDKTFVWYEFIQPGDVQKPGEIYKWRRTPYDPISLFTYVSSRMPELFEEILKYIKSNMMRTLSDSANTKTQGLIMKNFKSTIRNLSTTPFKVNVMKEASALFYRVGFSAELDSYPFVRGVANGVIKLTDTSGNPPVFIKGMHNYRISRFTDADYVPLDPRDPVTKEIIIAYRSIFPDNEPDTHDFVMKLMASTLDNGPKEAMFTQMNGGGGNGKSTVFGVLHKVIGDSYAVKMPMAFLTDKRRSAESASPVAAMLKDASLAYYSETDQAEELIASRIKELTGGEQINARKLFENSVNFKPRCHHIAASNHEFIIRSSDYGMWRRMIMIKFKIKFINTDVKECDPEDPYQRVANPDILDKWPEDHERTSKLYGLLVYHHYKLFKKYGGKIMRVPHQHIEFDTDAYRRRQDTVHEFITQRMIKTLPDEDGVEKSYNLTKEVQIYIKWMQQNYSITIAAKSAINDFKSYGLKCVVDGPRGTYLVGHRFLKDDEEPEDGEAYYISEVYTSKPKDNFGYKSETPEEYYEQFLRDFDADRAHYESGEYVPDADMSKSAEVKTRASGGKTNHNYGNLDGLGDVSTLGGFGLGLGLGQEPAEKKEYKPMAPSRVVNANDIVRELMPERPKTKSSTKITLALTDSSDLFMDDVGDGSVSLDE